jgi:hypothetical protein
MYAMIGTCPDLAHAVGILSQHNANPGNKHWNAVKQVLQYLAGMKDLCIIYRGTKIESVIGYTDADWAADKNDHCSLTRYILLLHGGVINWSSKKQPSTAQSSTEAEYVAAAHATKEIIWLRTFLSEINFGQNSPTPLFVDNQSAIVLTKNPKFYNWTKHIVVHFHFIHERVEDSEVTLEYVPMGDQIADALTKGLPRVKFEHFAEGMGLRQIIHTVDMQ